MFSSFFLPVYFLHYLFVYLFIVQYSIKSFLMFKLMCLQEALLLLVGDELSDSRLATFSQQEIPPLSSDPVLT